MIMFTRTQVKRHYLFGWIMPLLVFLPITLPAATSGILASTEVQEAAPDILEAEANLFKSIGMGLALALAQCEQNADCNVGVSKTELERLLKTLNDRIDSLVLRLESGDSGIETPLLMYATQRDNYLQYQKKLAQITPGSGTAAGSGKVDLSIFEDVDSVESGEEDLLIDDFDPSTY